MYPMTGHLWDALGYNYAAYVTDLDWAAEELPCVDLVPRGRLSIRRRRPAAPGLLAAARVNFPP